MSSWMVRSPLHRRILCRLGWHRFLYSPRGSWAVCIYCDKDVAPGP